MKILLVLLCVVFVLLCGCDTAGREEHPPKETEIAAAFPQEMPEDFSFSVVWGVMGIHSYSSTDGTLVKSAAEPDADAYRTVLILTEEERKAVWEILRALDWGKYPAEYDPNPDLHTSPSADITLAVSGNGCRYSVRCEDVALGYEGGDRDGQAFLDAVRALEKMLTSSEEWKALTDYTVLFM